MRKLRRFFCTLTGHDWQAEVKPHWVAVRCPKCDARRVLACTAEKGGAK